MDRNKLEKFYSNASYENIFGVTSADELYYNQIVKDADSAASYDDDSVKSMTDCCDTASNDLNSAASMYEDMADALEEWRSLAIDMWENLPAEQQELYVMKHVLSLEKRKALENSFKLEVLKDL